jgi:hypothetical protein
MRRWTTLLDEGCHLAFHSPSLDVVHRWVPDGKASGAWGLLVPTEMLDSCRPPVPCERC